jgi:hypothetical protein
MFQKDLPENFCDLCRVLAGWAGEGESTAQVCFGRGRILIPTGASASATATATCWFELPYRLV